MRQTPAITDRLNNGRVIKCRVYDRTRLDPWRDQYGRQPHTQTVEFEIVLTGRARRVGRYRLWRRNVIVAAAVLIIRENEQRPFPAFAVTYGPVDIIHQLLA